MIPLKAKKVGLPETGRSTPVYKPVKPLRCGNSKAGLHLRPDKSCLPCRGRARVRSCGARIVNSANYHKNKTIHHFFVRTVADVTN